MRLCSQYRRRNRVTTRMIACLCAMLATGCGVALQSLPPPSAGELQDKLGIEEIPYIEDDTFISNPVGLLGQVIEVRKVDGRCPANWKDGKTEFNVEKVQGFNIDEKSVMNTPVKRDSKLITASVASSLKFLNYLSAELTEERVISAILFDQAAARVADSLPSWPAALKAWKSSHEELFKDDSVCYLAVVRGMVQKNLVRRTFQKVQAGGGTGVYGVNVNGTYHTGAEDYSVDVRFGLSVGILKRPADVVMGLENTLTLLESAPTEDELKAAQSLTVIKHKR